MYIIYFNGIRDPNALMKIFFKSYTGELAISLLFSKA